MADINGGTLIYNGTDGSTFFGVDATVDLSNTTLNYTAQSSTDLNNDNFANIILANGAKFEYTATSGDTTIDNDFYTSNNGNNAFIFNGNTNSNFILNNNLIKSGTGTDTVTFNNANLAFANGLTNLTNNLVLNNSTIDVMDAAINDYTFSNLTANNSSLRIDVTLGSTPDSDLLTFNNGSGVLDITTLAILNDNGIDTSNAPKTVQVIQNTNGSSVSLLADGTLDPTIAAWSTNVYEYEINASQSAGSAYYDSLTFSPERIADANSLKRMNNYQEEQTRGFSLVQGADTYHIGDDLAQTEYGTFTVNGVSKADSIISGIRDTSATQGSEKGSFFELTDSKGAIELNIHDITIQDADRTSQDIKGGSIIYSNVNNAVINITDAAFKNSHAVGNGGAFDIEKAAQVNISGADFTGNSSDSLGGAIYSAVNLNITNSNFSGNTDSNGDNDITLANGANVLFTVDKGVTSNLLSGIKTASGSTTSTFTKTGDGTLNISGQNSGYQGNVSIAQGSVVFDTADRSDSFFGWGGDSKITISDGASLTIDNTANAALAAGHFAGSGALTINDPGHMYFKLYGDNADYTGTAVLNGTRVRYIAENDGDTIFGGEVQFLNGAEISTGMDSSRDYTGGNFVSDDNTAVFHKSDSGNFTVIGDNSKFTGDVILNGSGSTTFEKTEDTAFFGGDIGIGNNSTLNYTATSSETLKGAISGRGTINKDGAQTLTLTNSTFSGTANILEGTLAVTSTNANASSLDFTANLSSGAKLNYTAGSDSSITLGGDGKLNFVANEDGIAASGATASITADNIALDTIAGAAGNNIILNSANVTLNQNAYGGNYTINNSVLNLMADKDVTGDRISEYKFDSFSSANSSMSVDVSLAGGGEADKLVINGGSGQINISNFAIIDDDGSGSKSIQVIDNNGSTLSLAVGQNTHMADWSTNVYEYSIQADKSQGSDIYDSILFEAVKAATPDSLRTMNHERDGVRGFSVVNNSTYNIGRDLDTTLAGQFSVNGADKETSIISGKRADGYVGNEPNNQGTKGSFFEVVNDTDLTIQNLTIQDALRQNQTIKDGSVLYLNNTAANVTIDDVILTNNQAAGNGGVIAAIKGNLSISDTDFTNSTAGGFGGALYAANTVNITNSTFSNNTDTNGTRANDIYVADSGVVNFSGTSSVSSGIAGNGAVNINDGGTLNLTGTNSDFNGKLNVNSGSVNFTADDTNDSYISGVTDINSGSSVNIITQNATDLNISGTFQGNGTLNIGDRNNSNSGSVTVNGDNSGFAGFVGINNGSQLIVNIDSAEDEYFGSGSRTNINRGTLTFDIAQGIKKEITSSFESFWGDGGTFEKTGDGTLSLSGVWDVLMDFETNVEEGTLEFIAKDEVDYSSMIRGDIKISDGANFRVNNQTDRRFELYNNLKGGEGSIFEIAGKNGSVVDISNGQNSGFSGATLITSGDLLFTKKDYNSFVAGSVNIDNDDSTLTYSTDYTNGETISSLTGIGTLDKQGTGELTVNMDNFTGTADVNAGTLTINADELAEGADGSFGFKAEVAGGSTLNFNAAANDSYNINSNSTFKFDSENANGTINFANGSYNLSSDLTNAVANTTGFSNTTVNIAGENNVTLNGNYALNGGSTLNLANGTVTTTTIANLTTTGTNNLNLDFDFSANAFDKLVAKGGNAQITLTDNSINAINMENDRGLLISQTYDVLDGVTFANTDFTDVLTSNLYEYTVSVTDNYKLTLTASGYVGNTLHTLNHEISGERTFHLAGDSKQYYIGQALEQTLAGTLNIQGRTNDRADTIIGYSDENSSTGLSMFEVVNDNTTLNIDDITIQNAASSNRGGAVVYQSNENSTVNITNSTIQQNSAGNGGAIYVTAGKTNLSNVTLASNSATENGGAIYNAGDNLTLTDVTFSNNTAANGSAIYNLGSAVVRDASFNGNSSNYLYNGSNGNLTITATDDYILTNGTSDSVITNNGILNLTSAQDHTFTLADQLTGGSVNTSGSVILNNIISSSTVNVKEGSLAINGTGSAVDDALSSVTLNINNGTTASLGNKNINNGTINVAEDGTFNVNNASDISISSNLSGAGTINKTDIGTVSLSGLDNSAFAGDLNITNGTVRFGKTTTNKFFNSEANILVDGSNDGADSPATFAYSSDDTSYSFDNNFANITLQNGGTVSVSGRGRDESIYTLNSGWLNSVGTAANNLIFSDATYILNTLYNHTGVNDSITFDNSVVSLGNNIQGSEITDGHRHDQGALEYNLAGADYTLHNSVLDLSNQSAGDNYIFDSLNFTGGATAADIDGGITLDVNLYLDENSGRMPYADTITANSGEGIVEITRLFVTDDNGVFITNPDGTQSKGAIQIFKGNNNLQVADENNAQILSWATNVYRYGVKSAQTDRVADSIEITPEGASSTDTLRAMNVYSPTGTGGNRGFSFIAKDGKQENNNYNIYRDLDTTSAGTFTVQGTLVGQDKSVLSGVLKDLELLADDENLRYDAGENKWYYDNVELSQALEPINIPNSDGTTDPGYRISISEFTPEGQSNGSMFEIVNDTDFSMYNVSVQDAKRYGSDTIRDGSVIYARNDAAEITLNNVDFVNNEVKAGNGGAIANLSSNKFSITQSIISGNKAEINGGAIYNASKGMTIANATVDGNSAGGLGGAIYTSADMTISDSNFGVAKLNTHKGGTNDIYLAGGANVEFITKEDKTSTINSGIAGDEGTTFAKTGAGTLNLNGSNSDFNGTFDIKAGNVVYTANDNNDTFVGGAVKVNKGSTLTMDIAQSETLQQIMQNVSAGADGSGEIVKVGAGILNLQGDNSAFAGSTVINAGSIVYTADDNNDSYLGGSTELANADTNLTFIINQDIANQTVSNISGVAGSSFNKQGAGDLTISGDSSNFAGTANVENGTLIYLADNTSDRYFGGNTVISEGATLEANVLEQDSEGNDIEDQTIGNITGGEDANFVKTGDGKIQLIGDNTFTGKTTIENGTLAYTSGNDNYVNGNTLINADGTLEYTVGTGEDNLTAISGKGTLSKLGDGNLNLVGDNSQFTGSVIVGDGRLSYTSGNDNKFINANSYAIAQGAELYINNSTSDDVNVSNLSAYTDEENRNLGSGTVIKDGEGTLTLGGDNSGFEGALNINSGNVTFTKDNNTSYIAGNTDIASGAVLNYNTTVNDNLERVSGSGVLNKGGDGQLTFDANANSVDASFTANANQGTLNVIGDSTTVFDFNMIANNSAILNYTAAVGSKLTVGPNSVVGFGNGANGAQINFSSNSPTEGIYTLAGDLANYTGNQVSFDSSTIKLADSDYTYNGNYTITDSVIDLTENGTHTTTFENLTTSGSQIKIDVDLTLPDPTSDKLVSKAGSGGALELALKDINLKDQTTDNGLGESYKITVLGGNLTLDNDDSLDFWATSAYEYRVTIAHGGQNIILTAIKASDNNSLKAMNNQEGNRGFQFHSDDPDPYIIGESLGTIASGSFVVKGEENGSTVISGEDSKSFFEVTQDNTDLTVENVTIQDAHSDNVGSVVIANNGSSTVKLDNVNITSGSSDGNGGVINNTNSESFIINNSELTNNKSGGLGGAIYTADNITIIDTDFSGNSDSSGKNDIYVDGEDTVVDIVAANKDVSLSSGLAGNGTVNKSGNNDLNLSGKNDGFTGSLNVVDGDLNYTQSSASDTYISGNTNIGESNTVTITNNNSDITTGSFSGSGTLNKNGSNDMTLTGDNSNFTGTANINSGSVVFNSDDTKYISGTTNINQNGTLVVNADNNASLSKINGTGTVDKNGSGALIFQGNNNFSGSLNVNEGSFAMASGATLGNLANAQFAAGTGINLQNTSVVNLGNNNFTTNPSPASIENLYFDKLTLLGDVDLDIDIDLKNEIADKVGAGKVYGNGNLILDQDSLNVVSDSLLNNTSVQVAYGDLANHVALDQGVTTVMGPIQKYNVSYNNGSLFFGRQGGTTPDIGSVNPAVMASSVATQLGGYLTQLQTLNAGFYHMDRYTKYPYMMRLTAENTNRYAINDIPAYRRSNLPETSNAMWIQPYTTFEQVNLKGGIGVSNVAYGAMYGGDSNLVDLGHGFKGVLSTFVGYNGSHMSFNGVSMNQQGGALGVTGTLYKGNFFTGLTLSAGASAGDAYTQYGTDHFAMLTAGIASKTGYNWEMKDGKFIVQPSLFLGYTFANTFDYTNAAGVRIDSDPLHAITIVPGVKFIANLKNGWQPYLGVNMVWSIMDHTNVMAQDVRLPQLSVKPYVEYGVGVQKSWGERFTAFFQTMIRNGGRTGIVLTAGFRWALGKEPNYDNQKVQGTTQRKVIKSL